MKDKNMADVKVAFQGDHYAFSEMAAKKFFHHRCHCLPKRSFEQVFDSVEKRTSRYGIVPVENSLTGSIHRTYDLLLTHTLHIVGEVFLKIDQNLIANSGVSLSQIKKYTLIPRRWSSVAPFYPAWPAWKPSRALIPPAASK